MKKELYQCYFLILFELYYCTFDLTKNILFLSDVHLDLLYNSDSSLNRYFFIKSVKMKQTMTIY